MDHKEDATSELLERVVTEHKDDTISVGALKNALHERGFGVLMAIASLPLCIPVPVPPGYTTLFAIPLFILSVQMIWGMESPWLPNWLTRRHIKRSKLALLVRKANPLLRKIEKLLKPRWEFAGSSTGEKAIGVFAFIFSVSIAVPLPLTNLPPGYGILIMSLGLLSKDGVTIIIGMVIGVLGVCLTVAILIGGAELIESWMGDTPTEAIGIIIPHEAERVPLSEGSL